MKPAVLLESVCSYCPQGNLLFRLGTPYRRGRPCASCKDSCDRGLCTNTCPTADYWVNCAELLEDMGARLCSSPYHATHCQATCSCQ